ncbi:hypothetical protein D3C71_1383380 [compost metagenome]
MRSLQLGGDPRRRAQRVASVQDHDGACGGGPAALAGAFEQDIANLLLQLRQRLGRGGLRHVQPAGRAPQVALFIQSNHQLRMARLQMRTKACGHGEDN